MVCFLCVSGSAFQWHFFVWKVCHTDLIDIYHFLFVSWNHRVLASRLKQWQHMYVFSPVYVLRCLIKIVFLCKILSSFHIDCTYMFFFAACILNCISITLFCLKSLSHWDLIDIYPFLCVSWNHKVLASRLTQWQHIYVFSPVYVLKCLVKIVSCEKYFAHLPHLYGLLSVCVLKCISMILFCLKSLSHWLHWYLLFSVYLETIEFVWVD